METQRKNSKYLRAKKRVAEIKKFYNNLIMYSIFIAFMAGLNYYVNGFRNPWFLWVVFGFGISIFFQSIKVFNWIPFFGKDWEVRKMKEFMDKEERNNIKNDRQDG